MPSLQSTIFHKAISYILHAETSFNMSKSCFKSRLPCSLSRVQRMLLVAVIMLISCLIYMKGPLQPTLDRLIEHFAAKPKPLLDRLWSHVSPNCSFGLRPTDLAALAASGIYLQYVRTVARAKTPISYVGNGQLAVALDSNEGLFVKGKWALTQPVRYSPVVYVQMEGKVQEEINMLQMRSGTVNKTQSFTTNGGCVSVQTCLYAHRTRPSTLIQHLYIHNPTPRGIHVHILDQSLKASWDDPGLKTTMHGDNNYLGITVQYSMTSGVVAEDTDQFIALSIARTLIKRRFVTVPAKQNHAEKIITIVHYTKPGKLEAVRNEFYNLETRCKQDMAYALKNEPEDVLEEHTSMWQKLWLSGVHLSQAGAMSYLDNRVINTTLYYILSNVPMASHLLYKRPYEVTGSHGSIYNTGECYSGKSSLYNKDLWYNPRYEEIGQLVEMWFKNLDKLGCKHLLEEGADSVLQAVVFSMSTLKLLSNNWLQLGSWSELERVRVQVALPDTYININTHALEVAAQRVNTGEIWVSIEGGGNLMYYACGAVCSGTPIALREAWSRVSIQEKASTKPVVLYIIPSIQPVKTCPACVKLGQRKQQT